MIRTDAGPSELPGRKPVREKCTIRTEELAFLQSLLADLLNCSAAWISDLYDFSQYLILRQLENFTRHGPHFGWA
jgi:hypothetical protein